MLDFIPVFGNSYQATLTQTNAEGLTSGNQPKFRSPYPRELRTTSCTQSKALRLLWM